MKEENFVCDTQNRNLMTKYYHLIIRLQLLLFRQQTKMPQEVSALRTVEGTN